MPPRNAQRLELTWFNKDKALIPAERGKYGYAWVDPRDPRYCEVHTLVETETVTGTQADKVEGVNYSDRADFTPTTDNLLIRGDSGDVLEALHHVPELADKYLDKIKLCYIDPPFNTEKTFTHYEDNLEHSVWLTMMRDRLVHIRSLLAPEGSIWVHLDESESHRMRLLLDEVFGAGNFVAKVAWQKQYGPDNRSVFTQTDDSILVYAKNYPEFKAERNELPRSAAQDAAYTNPDDDPRGPWKAGDFTAQFDPSQNLRENQIYTLVTPAGKRFDPPAGSCWRYTKDRYEELLADDRVWFGAKGTGRPAIKRFRSEVMDGRVPETWWTYQEVGHNQDGKKEIKEIFPSLEPFATPKPERLLERIIHIATNPGDIVLDVFAGSGTTAAVAHKMGRRWVTAELKVDTVESFTRPRLEKVVRGEDPGGITATAGERIDATETGLPGELTADNAFGIVQAVGKAMKAVDASADVAKLVGAAIREDSKSETPSLDIGEAKELGRLIRKLSSSDAGTRDLWPYVRKSVGSQLKTKKSPDIIHWRGGGSFRVMELSPTVFDFDPQLELVMLTDAAHGDTLIASIAANLGFYRTPDAHPFHGRKGKMRLVVMEGAVTEQVVDDVLAHLPAGERVTIAALSVPDGVRKYLRQRSRGSVIKHVPDDLFSFAGDLSTASSEG